jgi:hypothetical protein
VLLGSARYPDWWRNQLGEHFFEVAAPALPRNSVLLILEDAPIAYVIPFFRRTQDSLA